MARYDLKVQFKSGVVRWDDAWRLDVALERFNTYAIDSSVASVTLLDYRRPGVKVAEIIVDHCPYCGGIVRAARCTMCGESH
jgi:hypothetical protein